MTGTGWQSLPNAGWRGSQLTDEILTLPEVAALLRVAEKTVYTMAQRSELPAFKIRGQWRFKRIDLEEWIERQKAADRPKRAAL
jgi:excisionase family DNA binding protein